MKTLLEVNVKSNKSKINLRNKSKKFKKFQWNPERDANI